MAADALETDPAADADGTDPSGTDTSGPDAAGAEAAEPAAFTIDELAAVSGVPSRTIRYYQSKGALPAPERRGRVAFYDDRHVERLRTIAELQDRGLRLDAIRDVLGRLEQGGDSLQEWLGVGDRLQAPWSDDRPVVLAEDELMQRLGDAGRRPGMLGELERLGLIERQGNSRPATFVVPSPQLLDIGIELDAAGVSATTAYEAAEILRKRLSRMTDELVEFFSSHAGDGFGASEDPEQIARAFEALRPLGVRAVQLVFAQEMERALREFVEKGGAIGPRRKR